MNFIPFNGQVPENVARIPSKLSDVHLHIVSICDFNHNFGVIILGEEVVVGFRQFQFNFKLNSVNELYPIKQSPLFCSGDRWHFGVLFGKVVLSILRTNLSNMLQNVIILLGAVFSLMLSL